MNIDFSDRPGFSFYVIFLMLAGIALVTLGGTPGLTRRRMTPLRRILNIVVGLGFFGYGFYLAFIFSGGHYFIFFYAFILPIVLIFRTAGGAAGMRRQTPSHYGAPGQPGPPGSPGVSYSGPPSYPGQPFPAPAYPPPAYPAPPVGSTPYLAAPPPPVPAEASVPAEAPVPAEATQPEQPPTMPAWPPTA